MNKSRLYCIINPSIWAMLLMMLLRSCGINYSVEHQPAAFQPVEDKIEDTDTRVRPIPTETGFGETQPTPTVTPEPAITNVPSAPSETMAEATATPEAWGTPVPDTTDTEDDGATEQDYTGSLLGEPDTDF